MLISNHHKKHILCLNGINFNFPAPDFIKFDLKSSQIFHKISYMGAFSLYRDFDDIDETFQFQEYDNFGSGHV